MKAKIVAKTIFALWLENWSLERLNTLTFHEFSLGYQRLIVVSLDLTSLYYCFIINLFLYIRFGHLTNWLEGDRKEQNHAGRGTGHIYSPRNGNTGP